MGAIQSAFCCESGCARAVQLLKTPRFSCHNFSTKKKHFFKAPQMLIIFLFYLRCSFSFFVKNILRSHREIDFLKQCITSSTIVLCTCTVRVHTVQCTVCMQCIASRNRPSQSVTHLHCTVYSVHTVFVPA